MCRINGIISNNINIEILLAMRDTMSYGGPDDKGYFVNDEKNLGLGHRRLSILDLTRAGHQPMESDRLVISYNGEIYNFKEISSELEDHGCSFSTSSDTEVILKAFECWGYTAVEKFRGMFAFAIYNKETRKLLLCRDRVGVKPLYWYKKDGLFMFTSELKAFHQNPQFDKTIDQDSVSLFLQTGYIRSPYSIFKYVKKVEPGCFLEIDFNLDIKIWKYWDLNVNKEAKKYENLDELEVINLCEEILVDSFKLRMVSDVPVGIFLSGGVDSSLVTALIQRNSATRLKTFTIGFNNKDFDESNYAKDVANHLCTDHSELICTSELFFDTLGKLPEMYDEPFGDSSAIPTFLVSNLAKQYVSVSLSADGGDELFGGYNRYYFAEKLFKKFSRIPYFIRRMLSNLFSFINVKTLKRVLSFFPFSSQFLKEIDGRLPKIVECLLARNQSEFIQAASVYITSSDLERLHLHKSKANIIKNSFIKNSNYNFSEYGKIDIESYLEGDILVKVDRATMQVALEGREPFLDHKLIEFALSLPDKFKFRKNKSKWILKEILNKYVPRNLIERPKSGFGIPLDKWMFEFLQTHLLEIKEDIAFKKTFNLNPIELSKIIDNYLNKTTFSPYLVWYIYCLHSWQKKWLK